jgi:hypothetical protein
MGVYFVFSDESGNYEQKRTENFLKTDPFHVRASLIIGANEWLRLSRDFKELKSRFNIPPNQEVKYSDAWVNGRGTSRKKFEFIENALSLLKAYPTSKLVYTITINDFNTLAVLRKKTFTKCM